MVFAGDFNVDAGALGARSQRWTSRNGGSRAGPGIDHVLVRGADVLAVALWPDDRRAAAARCSPITRRSRSISTCEPSRSQPELARDRLQRLDHVRDVLVELEPEQLGARVDLVAVHARRRTTAA